MREASAFAPGHLTGFFQICDRAENPLKKGSRGSGFSIPLGVNTTVKVEPAERTSINITINGKATSEAFVSENVANRMLSKLDAPHKVSVKHNIHTPLGAGFGSSGGGALSLALALNKALDLGISSVEAAQAAHQAEIECNTGLGTVIAEFEGGFGALIKPGAPGIGETVTFNHNIELRAVYLPFGPIPTKEALSDELLRHKINELGGRFVNEIHKDPSPALFMDLSRRFAEHIGLITPRLRAVLEETDAANIPCSMAMFGEVLFSLVEEDQVLKLLEVLREAAPEHRVTVTWIEQKGAHLI